MSDKKALLIPVGADLDPLRKAMNEGKAETFNTASAMQKALANAFGIDAVAAATKYAHVIKQVGDVNVLSERQQRKANDAIQEALRHYQRLGVEVPEQIKSAAASLSSLNQESSGLSKWFGRIGQEAVAFGAGMLTVQTAVASAKAAFRTAKEFVTESLDAYGQSELAVKRLDTALTNAGLTVPGLSERYQDYAKTLQAVSVYEDDAGISAAQMLVQIGGVLPSQMDRALKATYDFAAGMGVALPEAATAVAKAFQGSAKELAKLLPELKELQKDGLTATEVMTTLERHFGGAAAAEVDTYAGSIKQLANYWGEVKESVGKAILTRPEIKTWLSEVKNDVKEFSESIEKFGIDTALEAALAKTLASTPQTSGMATGMLTAKLAAILPDWMSLLGPGSQFMPPGAIGELMKKRIEASQSANQFVGPQAPPEAAKRDEEAMLKAADAQKRAADAAANHDVIVRHLREDYASFGDGAVRSLQAVAGAMDAVNERSKRQADALGGWFEDLEKAYRKIGQTIMLDEKGRPAIDAWGKPITVEASPYNLAIQDATRERDAAMKRAQEQYETAPAGSIDSYMYDERKGQIEREYQEKLKEAYDKYIVSATAAAAATDKATDAFRRFTGAVAPEQAPGATAYGKVASAWSQPGGTLGASPGGDAGTWDWALPGRSPGSPWWGVSGDMEPSWTAEKARFFPAIGARSGVSGGSVTVNLTQHYPIMSDTRGQSELREMIQSMIRDAISQQGGQA